jgi:hypothetical protein
MLLFPEREMLLFPERGMLLFPERGLLLFPETDVYHESEMELRRRVELSEIGDEEMFGRIVERFPERNEVDLDGNFDLTTIS